MSRLVVATIALGLLRASAAADTGAKGFDHVGHEGRVYAAGEDHPACASCHPVARGGRLGPAPGHDDCFGACHGPAPSQRGDGARAGDRAAVCASCHDETALTSRRPRVAYPPYRVSPDFAIALSHERHDAAGPCTTCHQPGKKRARRGHADCARCHAAAEPAMDACESCHQRAFGPARGPRHAPARYPVTATFDHQRHERHLSARERPCLTCHAAVADAGGDVLPRPAMTVCEPCHDGSTAFAALATECRRCHAWIDQPPREPAPRGLRPFAHDAHREVVGDCRRCHELGEDGRALPAGRGHAPCAEAACHADDFRAVAPVTCGVCHVGVEPWRALHRHRLPAAGAFGMRFGHAAHRADERSGVPDDCLRCHAPAAAGVAVRGGHALCSGDGCHGPGEKSAAEPGLAACAACHAAPEAEPATRWSVAARFRHAPHARTSAGDELGCERCHRELGDGPHVPPPEKSTCAPCHDGRTAFKMTGHGCERCHGGP